MEQPVQTGHDVRVERPDLPARWDLRSVAGVAVLGVAVTATAVGLLGSPFGGGDGRDTDTVVGQVRGTVAVVTACDALAGSGTPVSEGDVLPDGAVLRSASSSGVVLETGGRRVELAPSSCLAVLDGMRQDLRGGLVLVDTREGPELALEADAAEVRSRGGVVRVDSGTDLRVASYRGSADVQPVGRRAVSSVPALREARVPLGGLPGLRTLSLTPGDTWEARPDVAGAVVRDNAFLEQLAAGLDSPGGLGARAQAAVPASLRQEVPTLSDARPSEIALGYAVARVAETPEPEVDRYRAVRAGRDTGGSWGVVAALVSARTSPTSAALDGLVSPDAPQVPVVRVVGSPAGEDLLDGVVSALPGTPTAPPVVAPPPARPPVAPPVTPVTPPVDPTPPVRPPTPAPTPEPEPGLVDGLLGTVGGLLGGLLGGAGATEEPDGLEVPQLGPRSGTATPTPSAPAPSGNLVDGLLDLLSGG